MNGKTVVCARLNIGVGGSDKEYLDEIYDVLNQKSRYTRNDFEYVVSNLGIIPSPDENAEKIVYGIFNKIRKERAVEVFDYESWTPIQDGSVLNVNIHSKFFIFPDHVIIFEEIPNQISVVTFKKIFIELLLEGARDLSLFMQFSLESMKEENEVYEFINGLDKVTNVVFKGIQIPNPKSKPIWKLFEDTIKDTGATNISHTNTVDGLNVDSETFKGGFDLCHAAYMHEYVVAGNQNGHVKKFSSTRDKNIKRTKIFVEDFEDLINKIIDIWRKL